MAKILNAGFLRDTARYVEEYMKSNLPVGFVFHNFSRALKISRICDILSVRSDLREHEKKLLHLAALFIDSGYCIDSSRPAMASASLAKNYLDLKGLDGEAIDIVTDAIEATGPPQQPVTLLGQYLCDANLYFAGSRSYIAGAELERKELELVKGIWYTDQEWASQQIRLLEDHTYFTAEARKLFRKGRRKSISLLQQQLHEIAEASSPVTGKEGVGNGPESEHDFKAERGVETLFRVTARKQLDLTRMADSKANLIIGVNAIIISFVVSVLGTRLKENSHLLIPAILIVITNATTIVIAILAARPTIIRDTDTVPGKESAEFNVLFFGHFSRMSLEHYKDSIRKTIMKKEEIYDTMSRDIYYQGIILARKYRFIAFAYNVFMVGLILSIIGFVIAFIFRG